MLIAEFPIDLYQILDLDTYIPYIIYLYWIQSVGYSVNFLGACNDNRETKSYFLKFILLYLVIGLRIIKVFLKVSKKS